jgi:hypothetical protein
MWPWGAAVARLPSTMPLYDAFKRACTASRIDNFHFDDLRASLRVAFRYAGVDSVTVKELLGHKQINMTLRYPHLIPEHKTQAVARLGERFKADESKSQNEVVAPELKEAINAILTPKLEQNRRFFW